MRLGVTMQAVQDTLYDAFGQRQISTIFSQSEPVPRHPGGEPGLAGRPDLPATPARPRHNVANTSTTGRQRQRHATRRASNLTRPGAARRPSPPSPARRPPSPSPTSRSSPPSPSASTSPPAPASATPCKRSRRPRTGMGLPDTIAAATPATPPSSSQPRLRALADPGRRRRHLHRARRALREHDPPRHHPLHPPLRRHRRAPRPDAAPGRTSRLVALVGIVLLMGIVKKNAIILIDFAIEAERDRGRSPEDAIEEACAAPLPPHHDDHRRRPARRPAAGAGTRHRLRTPLSRSASPSSAACC